jgi:predicted Zn-dependent protease
MKREQGDILYPCNLGMKISLNFSDSIMSNLKDCINSAFDSFFYNIFVSNWSLNLHKLRTLRREKFAPKVSSVIVYPTDLFYNSLKNNNNLLNKSNIQLGITHLPLYSSTEENLIFLYGEAYINQKCAVVSTYNLRNYRTNKADFMFERRLIKECIHELGHIILGNDHCLNSYCVMNYSNNLEKVDNKSIFPCTLCSQKLEIIRENYNF